MVAIPQNYKRGLDWLNDHRPFFTVMVTNLGVPVDDRRIDTACVRLRPGTDIFEFAVNEEFLEPLSDEEVAGVISHEGYHILFDHLGDFNDDTMTDKRKRVLSQECICNDNIVDEGILLPDLRQKDKDTGELKGGLFFGPNVVGRPVSGYTTKEVYDLLTDEQAEEAMPSAGDILEHLGDLSPEEAEKLKDALKKAVQDAIDEGRIEESDIPSDSIKDLLDIGGISTKAGTEGEDGTHALADKGLTLEWAKYLRKIDPTAFQVGGNMGNFKASWHAPRRKIAYLNQRGIRLPSYAPKVDANNFGGGMKPHIVLALDFSGSIPENMLDVMSNLAHTVPNTIDVSCCTFSTFFKPYNPALKRSQDVARGGTDFDAIPQFIDTLKLKQYPSVVVITDGQANFNYRRPQQDQLDKRWNWLLINRYNSVYERSVNNDTVQFLDEYVQNLYSF